jgi:hypothetical protein
MARGGRSKKRKAPAAVVLGNREFGQTARKATPVEEFVDAILATRKEDVEVIMSVEDAIAEIQTSLAEIDPQHEGLRDYAALDLQPETRAEIQTTIVIYDRRVNLLRAALAALEALVADGHPELPVRVIPEASYEDLVAQQETITAALAKFSAQPQAASLGITSEAPEPK